MPVDILQFGKQHIIEAKIEYTPAEAVPAGLLAVRNIDNEVIDHVTLTRANIDTWIDLTRLVQRAGDGIVEAELLRTVGKGKWSARLRLRASHDAGEVADLETGEQNHLDPSVLFGRVP